MKKLSALSLGVVSLTCSLLLACSDEQEMVPQMQPAKVTTKAAEKSTPAVEKKKAETPAPAPTANTEEASNDQDLQLVPLQSLSAPKEEAPAAAAPETPAPAANGNIALLDSGEYVIQVSITSSKKVANETVKKLSDNNIKAYIVEVENPGELEGTYYRIRVGYFANSGDAQAYGKQALTALNFAWWVDKSKNDKVGNPNPDSNSKAWEDETAPAPAPAPAPAVAPAAPPAPAAPAAPSTTTSEPDDYDDWE